MKEHVDLPRISIFASKEHVSMLRQNIVFFTGVGISAESGIPTFRGAADGLWRKYDPYRLCSASGFYEDPQTVLDFYNKRRRNLLSVEPNAAHRIIAQLERYHDIMVLTQNVDNLHERAGSSHVVHLHGELTKVTSSKDRLDPACIKELPLDQPIRIGDLAADDSQLRPYVVFFDEYAHWDDAEEIARNADVFVVVSTSRYFPTLPRRDVPRYVVDPVDHRDKLPERYIWINAPATRGLELLLEEFTTKDFALFEATQG